MTTATPEVNLSDAELLGLATTYIALRSELIDRGAVLANEISNRSPGKTLIVYDGDAHYELSRNYSPGRYELPVGVAPAEVLRA